jgi:transposase-like protein
VFKTELGIPIATLHSWIQQLKHKAEPAPVKGEPNKSQNVAALIEENRRLHKELATTLG